MFKILYRISFIICLICGLMSVIFYIYDNQTLSDKWCLSFICFLMVAMLFFIPSYRDINTVEDTYIDKNIKELEKHIREYKEYRMNKEIIKKVWTFENGEEYIWTAENTMEKVSD